MQDSFNELRRALSSDRLVPYARNAHEHDTFCRYLWNVALSEALYPSLQYFEIALRNSLYDAISADFNNRFWLDRTSLFLRAAEIEKIETARNDLAGKGKADEPARIVAELNFGFWTSLFNRHYEHHKPGLWPRLLEPTFPYLARTNRTRAFISKRVNEIRLLRNRVFHHEPVWHWSDLQQQYLKLVQAIGWINPSLCATLTALDRFPGVFTRGWPQYRQGLIACLPTVKSK